MRVAAHPAVGFAPREPALQQQSPVVPCQVGIASTVTHDAEKQVLDLAQPR